MTSSDFVHLHCHSEFSLLDGANKLGHLIKRAAEMEMPAIALTDHGVMFGVGDFYGKCHDAGIKPVLGVEAYVAPRRYTDKQPKLDQSAYHMVLLARNNAGYRNLLKLTSIAALEGFYYKPRVDRDLLQTYSEGVIATTACLGSEINQALLQNDYEKARDACAFYRDTFGAENYYVELQNHNLPEQIHCNSQLLKIARELHLPVICSNDVHYLTAGDADAHDILLCIGTGATVTDESRLRYATQEFYLKSAQQMKELFGAMDPHCIENTLAIAERCNVELEFGRCPLPSPGIPEHLTPHEYLTQLAYEGLSARFGSSPPPQVSDRLKYELDIIQSTGFSQYILIVRDFADFAAKKGIFFGVRGSAAGSLTSYLVGITDIDPVEYGLTFERFLNPERVQMPDVDMDFEDARRSEVIDYVTQKYSPNQSDPTEARVAQIVTFGTLAARAVLKDAGRALGYAIPDVERLCKMIPTIPVGMTIDKTMEANQEFSTVYQQEPAARKLIDTARRLEGISRHSSVHAAGVIISHEPLVNYTPLQKSADGGCVTQYPAGMLEKIGLLKMDFLGLINLSILAQAVRNVEQSTGKRLDVRKLPLDDANTYELLARGDCVGVFQLESPQMRRYIQELQPGNVREVAAIVALYRPGPMAHIPRFIRCKHGQEKIEYPHPLLKDLLEETYGVIVYQDQVMRIAQIIAGYTLGQADVLRRAMGKKKKEEMVKQREKFIEGAAANNISKQKADEIFDLMEPFAGYAFNKAHAVCYAMVAYQTAYLKANYPLEYMAALMACFLDKSDKLVTCMDECKRMSIPVLPPDINASGADFTVEPGKRAIRYGLAAIKNVGKAAVDAILHARSEGPFTSLEDFCNRTVGSDSGGVTKSVMETLVHAGAFSSLPGHTNRRAVCEVIDDCIAQATQMQRSKKLGQGSLDDMFGDSNDTEKPVVKIPNIPEFSRAQLLGYERELLGLYITDHPLQEYSSVLAKAGVVRVSDLSELPDKKEVKVGGMLTQVKPFTSKKSGEAMVFFTLEDLSGQVSCTMFPSSYAKYRDQIEKDRAVILDAKVSYRERVRDGDQGDRVAELLVEGLVPLGSAVGKNGGTSKIVVKLDGVTPDRLKMVRETMEHHKKSGPAGLPIFLELRDNSTRYEVKTELFADYSDAFRQQLESLLGRQSVWQE